MGGGEVNLVNSHDINGVCALSDEAGGNVGINKIA